MSPFIWDQLDNLLFARLSRGLAIDVHGESINVNSLDEVADSSWFTNRSRAADAQHLLGACKPEDMLPTQDQVADGTWVIDHGKDNGSTLGFRVDVPGKGQYMLKADDEDKPERASAASVIGAALYDAVGFNTTCEQVVVLRRAQLKLTPHLKTADNSGVQHVFDDAALDKVLSSTTQMPGHMVRMQASKWLPGLALGPFRYIGTRSDDPNDVIDHADRRELRGSRILAAWIDHWDAREQNSMDVWMSDDAKAVRSSPGHVVHYILDTSDTMGGEVGIREMSVRLGHSYEFDGADILHSLVTLGIREQPWDRASYVPGREKFAYFTPRDFNPARWKPTYPNPAFLRMTERDAAWMARLIARFSEADIRRLVQLGKFTNPTDVDYLTGVLVSRQRAILARYFGRVSPLGEVHTDGGRICATDFARLRELAPAAAFHYAIVERGGGQTLAPVPEVGADGVVCFTPRAVVSQPLADADPGRIVTFEIRNGTTTSPLVIHTYDLGERGMRVVGLTR